MPDRMLDQRKRVLIVDQSADSRSVFRTALERRGMRILEAPGARQGLDIVRQERPEVVVLDWESLDWESLDWESLDWESAVGEDASVRAAYQRELTSHGAELVILGNLRRSDLAADQHLVRKPYHYGPLIRKIEQLIEHAADNRQ